MCFGSRGDFNCRLCLCACRCLWVQEKDGNVLYSGEEVSEPLEMVIVPATLANTQTFYVFQVRYQSSLAIN